MEEYRCREIVKNELDRRNGGTSGFFFFVIVIAVVCWFCGFAIDDYKTLKAEVQALKEKVK